MPPIPDDAVAQLGELPIVVAVLLIAMGAVVGVVWIGARLLSQRDAVFMKFFGDQRELDRALGKQTSDTTAGAINQLADAIRDNGTATLALIQGMSDKVDQAMDAHTNALRNSNNLIASLARDVDEMLRRAREATEEHAERRGKR